MPRMLKTGLKVRSSIQVQLTFDPAPSFGYFMLMDRVMCSVIRILHIDGSCHATIHQYEVTE